MRIIALLPLAAAVLSVAGCGSYSNPIYGEHGLINDRSQNYEEAKATQRLELPPAIEARSKAMQDSLEVPSAGQTASKRTAEFVVPRPEFFYADAGNGTVNLKRQGDEKVLDRKSTCLNSSHITISYAVFCLKKKKKKNNQRTKIQHDLEYNTSVLYIVQCGHG